MQHQEAKAKHAKPSGTITKNIFYRHSTTISQEKNMHHRSFHAVTHLCIWWESGPQKWTAGCGSWPYMDITAYNLCSYAWLELFRCFVRNSIKCGTVSWYEPYLSIRFLFVSPSMWLTLNCSKNPPKTSQVNLAQLTAPRLGHTCKDKIDLILNVHSRNCFILSVVCVHLLYL